MLHSSSFPITTNEAEQARFLQEARAAALLNHPNICTVHAIEKSDSDQFIVMEYVDGQTLRQRETWNLKPETTLAYAIQIAEALQEAHSKGIVHRDIKLDNIMVNSKNQIKVMDFGLAKLKGSLKLTKTDSTVGTLAYMAPEQIQGGDADARSDIFSFAVVLYEMLTGHLPFRGEHEAAMMYSILNENPDSIDKFAVHVPLELQHIVGRSLEKDPRDRFQSAADMVRELRLLQKQTSQISSTRLHQAPPRKKQILGIAFAVIAVGFILATSFFNFFIPASETRKSVAVLPFENLNAADDVFFSDGITEDIITQLSKIRELRVISSLSILKHKNNSPGTKEIGTQLGVSTVLQGSVRRLENQLRITARLIDVANNDYLWAETFDREEADVFAIQSEIAQKIASALKAELTPSERRQIEKKPTSSIKAYDLYLKGREYYYSYRKQENENAILFFKSALQLDPDYALAYSGLGDSYAKRTEMFEFGHEWVDSSIAVSTYALALDSNLAEAHKSLGFAYALKGWLQKALECDLRSVELNPNYFPGVYSVAWDYTGLGRLDDALTWMKRGMRLSPNFPRGYVGIAMVEWLLGEDSQAERSVQRALDLDSNLIAAHEALAEIYLRQGKDEKAEVEAARETNNNPTSSAVRNVLFWVGRYDEARPLFEEAMNSLGQPPEELGFIYWRVNRRNEAHRLFNKRLETLREEKRRGSISPWMAYSFARIYSVQGNKTEAYQYLHEAINNGWVDYRLGRRDPFFENIRNDEQFRQMMYDVEKRVEVMRVHSRMDYQDN